MLRDSLLGDGLLRGRPVADGRRWSRTPRWARRLLVAGVVTMLAGSTGTAWLRQGARVVTVDDALRDFRTAAPASAPTTTPSPTEPTSPPPGGATDGADPAGAPPSTMAAAAGRQNPSPSAGPQQGASGPAASEGSPTGAPAKPASGVYVYATSGYEATNALGGSRHDYPPETAITLHQTDCGWQQRWQPLKERWDESELCFEGPSGEDTAVRRFSTYHEFFRQGQQQDFTCPEGSHVYRGGAAPGQTWNWSCTNAGGRIDTVTEFVGIEELEVGGQSVQAVHMRYQSTLSGSNSGRQAQERWLHVDTGLNLKIVTDVDTDADSPFGRVHYEEHYTITLSSLEPRQ